MIDVSMVITFIITMELSSVKKTTIRAIGNSAGVTIPKVLLEKYNLHEDFQQDLLLLVYLKMMLN
jgi:putative transposon-encoded protein